MSKVDRSPNKNKVLLDAFEELERLLAEVKAQNEESGKNNSMRDLRSCYD